MTDKPTLNDLAPYPDFLSQVTAEGIARHNAVLALEEHHLRMKLNGLVDGHAWKEALRASRTGWAVALLLRALIEHAGSEVADDVARALWKDWDDSQDFAPQLARWVSEAGVDPAVLVEMAQDSYEQVQKLKTLRVPGQGELPLGGEA
ncbi:hypothetical protein ACGFNP_25610 [Nonomuraea sp. NPDC049269]|uniref:hypothetical protein n=1 Tax=Nonomuraea sp. NPDC049269 TaxID=3364349 RepID=UPI0037134C5D